MQKEVDKRWILPGIQAVEKSEVERNEAPKYVQK